MGPFEFEFKIITCFCSSAYPDSGYSDCSGCSDSDCSYSGYSDCSDCYSCFGFACWCISFFGLHQYYQHEHAFLFKKSGKHIFIVYLLLYFGQNFECIYSIYNINYKRKYPQEANRGNKHLRQHA